MSIKQKIKKTPKLLVLGDFILDQYYWTSVSRISPEAPVPVCHIQETTHCLGGAGNVANNLSAFGAKVSVAGIVGIDSNADKMKSHFNAAGINTNFLIEVNEYPTICKSRVMAKGQQLCRLDDENLELNMDQHIQNCMDQLRSKDFEYDGVVISDYNKGVVSESLANQIIQIARKHSVPVVVDPKGEKGSKYTGATYITPNTNEFNMLTGLIHISSDHEVVLHGQELIKKHNIEYVILTRSEKGMMLISNEGHHHYPTKAIEVSDVTGAGDTIVAAVAFGMALGWDQDSIMNMANGAAGVVVSKVGTATASIEEIEAHESNF